jgi:hypothetical protein
MGVPRRLLHRGTLSDGRRAVLIQTFEDVDQLSESGDVITEKEVLGLFKESAPNWKVLPKGPQVRGLVQALNILRVTTHLTFDAESPAALRVKRVQEAIDTLATDLPAIIEAGRQSLAYDIQQGQDRIGNGEEKLRAIEELLVATQSAKEVFTRRAPGKRVARWHETAEAIFFYVESAWIAAGRAVVGVGAASPAVNLVGRLLERVGEEPQGHDAISSALTEMRRDIRIGSAYENS